jgi:LysM repeat protein
LWERGAAVVPGAFLAAEKGSELVEYFLTDDKEVDEMPTKDQIEIMEEDENTIKEVFEKKEIEEKEEIPAKNPIKSEEVEFHEREGLAEALSFGKESDVVFDKEFLENIEKHWLEKYGVGGKLHRSLRSGFKRMQPWMDLLKKHFSKTEHSFIVDEKVRTFDLSPEEAQQLEKNVYLAIPESHFQIESKSEKGAQGPYQFMGRTARKAKLKIGGGIDERYDPALSAEACAANLVYLYKQCGDWDLALSGYNGGFIWKYFSKERNIKERTYEGFIKFVQDEVNKKRELIKNSEEYVYKVNGGDTLSKIAKRFSLTVEEIKKKNNLKSDIIHRGQEIKIPLKDSNHRKEVFNFLVKKNGLIENLNYPAKFNAVYKIIESGAVDDLASAEGLEFKEIVVPSKIAKDYKVKTGDNFSRIGRKFGISVKSLMKMNKKTSPDINAGESIKVVKTKRINLSDLVKTKEELKILQRLNPAIRSVRSPLPKDYKIRTLS